MQTIPSDIVKVRFLPRGAKRRVTWYGKIVGRKDGLLTIRRYTREGEEYSATTDPDVEQIHLAIITEAEAEIIPQVMNLHYGELEDSSTHASRSRKSESI